MSLADDLRKATDNVDVKQLADDNFDAFIKAFKATSNLKFYYYVIGAYWTSYNSPEVVKLVLKKFIAEGFSVHFNSPTKGEITISWAQ